MPVILYRWGDEENQTDDPDMNRGTRAAAVNSMQAVGPRWVPAHCAGVAYELKPRFQYHAEGTFRRTANAGEASAF